MSLTRRRSAVVVLLAVAVVAAALVVGAVVVRPGGSDRPDTVGRPGSSVPSGPGRVVSVVAGTQSPTGYLAYLPPGYATSGHTYPAIVYLHGIGEAGNGGDVDLQVLRSAGLPRLAATGTLPASARGFVILAPQSAGPYVDVRQIHRWLAATLPRYRIDRARLYLTGISMGGEGVFDYLAAYGDASGFAAVVPISGNFTPLPIPDGLPDCRRMADTPMWAFHGADDDVEPVQAPIAVVAYVNRVCHPPQRLRLTVYQDSFHNVWDRTYSLSGRHDNPTSPDWSPFDVDLYAWLLQHRLGPRRYSALGPDARYLPVRTD